MTRQGWDAKERLLASVMRELCRQIQTGRSKPRVSAGIWSVVAVKVVPKTACTAIIVSDDVRGALSELRHPSCGARSP